LEARTALGGDENPGLRARLLEREAESAVLTRAVEHARRGRGSLVLVDGPPGIGKSSLLAASRETAAESGLEVLQARGRTIERDFTFGVALQLFEARVARARPQERSRLLSGAARLAAPLLAPGPRDGLPEEGEAFSLLHGLYWLCANLADGRPLAMFVDDGELADLPSLRFLLYLANRIADLPACLVIAARLPAAGPELRSLADVATHPAVRTVRLRPLSPEAVATQLRSSWFPDADERFCQACYRDTKGNPFLLHELGVELAAQQVEPNASGAERVPSVAPGSVGRWASGRLAAIGPDAVPLAQAVAVLGDGAELRHAALLAGMELADAARTADSLMAVDLLRPADRLAFVHPLVARALEAELSPAERGEVHLKAARVLWEDRVADELIATHLLLARRSGSEWAVAVLSGAAAVALSRGDLEKVVRYMRRALAEPPTAEARASLLVDLGRAESRTGDPAAVGRLHEAIGLTSDPGARAAAALEAGRTLCAQARFTEAGVILDRGLDELGGRDEPMAAQLRATRAMVALVTGEARTGSRHDANAALAREAADEPVADSPEGHLLLARFAIELVMDGRNSDGARELARRALGRGALLDDETSDGLGYYLASTALVVADDLQTAELALTAAVEDALTRGSALGFAIACGFRAWPILRRGRIADAEADAAGALAAVSQGSWLGLTVARSVIAETLIERGRLEDAEQELSRAGRRESDGPLTVWEAMYLASRARLKLLTCHAEEALADYEDCGRQLADTGFDNPAVVSWRAGAALACAKLGDPVRARQLAREEVDRARAFGSLSATGRGLHTSALVETGARRLDLLGEAIEVLERSPAALARAQALLDLGAALRRAGRKATAREPLRRALDLAERCGASATVERAARELTAAGARPRRSALSGAEALTARERQVAELAADGMSNREIADALFVTVKTVEWHLRHCFTKLGVTSRRELGGELERRAAAGS
jgi:DNA-binding CsgD family transcriptional regulator